MIDPVLYDLDVYLEEVDRQDTYIQWQEDDLENRGDISYHEWKEIMEDERATILSERRMDYEL